MSNEETYTQKREHFRLEYPKQERPILRLKAQAFEVIDLSEKGIKFHIDDSFSVKPNASIKGILQFKDESTIEISGRILRISDDDMYCVAHLDNGVPYAKMLEEQRIILQRYKT